ncbi:hypothetical protein [Actinokineospora pegani]|uniref:hypothetical protein n=1 Tax=Actinokineospora pegani TaxID=2654637 RepID=UPI0012EA8430|nr:hypothetical protein [Actinokineospora pegani]
MAIRLRAAVLGVVLASLVAGCSSPSGHEEVAAPVDAARPSADGRVLHATVTGSVLVDQENPVARVEVERDGDLVEVTVWLRQRRADPDEAIIAIARVVPVEVPLDEPLGEAAVYDGSADPPRLVRIG